MQNAKRDVSHAPLGRADLRTERVKQSKQPPLRIANGLSQQELCSEGETP